MVFKLPDISSSISGIDSDYENIKKKYGFNAKTTSTDNTGISDYEEPVKIYDKYDIKPTKEVSIKPLNRGEFITEEGKSQNLLKKTRGEFDPAFNSNFRNGLPSWNFEIDHIVPLWAGGADTTDNKEVLTKKKHADKTKVGAIAQALYYNKKATLNEARIMQLNWEDKDVDDIDINDLDKGQIDLETAERKAMEWTKPKKVGLKEWWESFKEGPKGIAGEFAQGTASGATLGWVPAEAHQYKDEDLAAKAGLARVGGEVLGTLSSFALGYGLLGRAAQGALGVKKVATGVKSARTMSEMVKTASRAPTWLKNLSKSKPLFKAGGIAIPRDTTLKILANTGVFTTIGQLSKQEEAGFEARTKRFLNDAAWGGVLSVPGQSAKGYVGLATGAWVLSSLEGATPMEALKNTAFMVGMHGIGRIGYKEKLDQAATKAATETRAKYGGVQKQKYTAEEINAENKLMFDKIKAEVSPTDQAAEIEKIIISGRQLYKGGLGTEQRLKEDMADINSMFKRTNRLSQAQLEQKPASAVNFKNGFETFKNNPVANGTHTNEPIGTILNTGVANKKTPITTRDILAYKNNRGTEGDYVFGVLRDEPEFVKAIQKKDVGLFGRTKNSKYDDKNVEWFGTKNGEIYQLGTVPTKENIKGQIIRTNKPNMPQVLNSEFNNVAISEAMAGNNYKVIPGKLVKINISKKSGETYTMVELSPETWKMAKGLNTEYSKTIAEDINKAIAKKPVPKRGEHTVYSYDNLPTSTGSADAYFNINVKEFKNAFSSGDPVTVKQKVKDMLGITISDKDSKRASELTVGDYIDLINDGKSRGQLNTRGNDVYNLNSAPSGYFKSLGEEELKKLRKMYIFGEDEAKNLVSNRIATTGQISQNIPVEPISPNMEIPFKNRVEKKMEAVKKTAEKVNKEIKETTKKAIASAKERFKPAVEKSIKVKPKVTSKKILTPVKESLSAKEVAKTASEAKERFTMEPQKVNDSVNPKKFNEYQDKVNRGAGELLEKRRAELVESGDIKGAAKLTEVKHSLTREAIKSKVDLVMKESNGDLEKAYKQYKKDFTERIFEKNGIKDPFINEDANQVLKHGFIRTVYSSKRKIFTLNKNKTMSTSEKELDIKSPADLAIERYNKKNGTKIDIAYFDKKGSDKVIKHNMGGKEQMEKIHAATKANGYITIGPSGADINTVYAIKYNKGMMEKFDKNPSRYLKTGESAPTTPHDKFIRVFITDTLGMEKGISAKDLLKRSKIFNNHNTPNVAPEANYKHYILPNVSVGKKNLIDTKLIGKDSSAKSIESVLAKSENDGKIFMSQELINEITHANGYVGNFSSLKPFTWLNRKLGGDRTSTFLQKGDIVAYDGHWKNMFEKQLGKKIGKYDVISSEDNIKNGLGMITPKKASNGNMYREIDVPSTAYQFQYANQKKLRASHSLSILGKYGADKPISDAFVNWYKPQIDKFRSFSKELSEAKDSEGMLAAFKKNYKKDLEIELYEKYSNQIKKGAGKHYLEKQISPTISNILKKNILGGKDFGGATLRISPDLGYIKNGKTTHLKSGEVMMSRETWKEMGKPSEIMGLRYPVTHKLNMKKNKVLISEDYGIKGLKKGNTVLSQHDTYVNHFGDYDGDIVQLFPIGGKKGFPNLVMDSIEAERKKMGEILVDASIEKKFEKLPPTEKNLLEISSNAVMGEQVVGSTSALVRIMPTLVDNKMRIEFSSSKNWEPRKYSVYYGDYKHSSGIIKQDGKAHKQRTLKPVWNRENEKLAIQLNNAGTDAISSPALIGMGWEPNFLLKKFFGTSDDNAVGAVRNMLFPKKGVSPQTPYKITLSKGKEPLDSILKDIKDYNELSQNIVKGGGKLTPTQNVVAELKGVTSYGELDNKSRLLADTFASTAVKNAVEIPAITPNSQKFINFAENLIEKSSRNFSDKAMKKTNRKKIVDYYNKGLTQFNKEDIDRISYWAITNPKANWAKIAGTKTPSKFVWRFDEFFEPKQAKIFFNAYEESAAKSIKSLNKNTEPK